MYFLQVNEIPPQKTGVTGALSTTYRQPYSPNEVFSSLENLIGRLDSENVEFYLM